MPKIVLATVEELSLRGIKEARIESVVTHKTDKATKIRKVLKFMLQL